MINAFKTESPQAPGNFNENASGDPLLRIKDLSVSFGNGAYLPVRSLDLTLGKGEVAGLVGESGSGKSLTAFSLMGLLPFGAKVEKGEILFGGKDLIKLEAKERRKLCGSSMGMIFQEPLSALNPVLTIGEQVSEIFRYKRGIKRKEARDLSYELLAKVGLPNAKAAYGSYPHRFSGGMRQRVVIAMALSLNPELVIADEPTTALDPTIANQIINLLRSMTAETGTSVLFITHNLRLLTNLAAKIFVMYAGLILEESAQGLENPIHPYAKGLVNALPPNPSEKSQKALIPIPGSAPGPGALPGGCPFAPRCAERFAPCEKSLPPLLPVKPEYDRPPGAGRTRALVLGKEAPFSQAKVRCFRYS